MPLHLESIDVQDELAEARSALIVSCPVCPPVSLAMQRGAPWLEPLRHGVKTEAFEAHIRDVRDSLERRGIKTGVFRMWIPSPMMCVWTSGQRKRLLKRAADYDAVVVLGCDSSREVRASHDRHADREHARP